MKGFERFGVVALRALEDIRANMDDYQSLQRKMKGNEMTTISFKDQFTGDTDHIISARPANDGRETLVLIKGTTDEFWIDVPFADFQAACEVATKGKCD